MEASTFTVRLDELLRAGQYEDAACLLDEAELERDDAAADEAVLKEWPSALHILCLILSDRLADARFLYKRLPQPCAALDEVQAAWTVLRLLWQQKHSEVAFPSPEALETPRRLPCSPLPTSVTAGHGRRSEAARLCLFGSALRPLPPRAVIIPQWIRSRPEPLILPCCLGRLFRPPSPPLRLSPLPALLFRDWAGTTNLPPFPPSLSDTRKGGSGPSAVVPSRLPARLPSCSRLVSARLSDRASSPSLPARSTPPERTGPQVWAVLQRAPWSPRAAAAAAALTEKLRGEVAALLGKAYTTLGLAKAAGVLGLSEAEAAAAAQRLGWELDPGAGLLRLPRARLAAEAHGAGSRLQQLVDYVVHLEQ